MFQAHLNSEGLLIPPYPQAPSDSFASILPTPSDRLITLDFTNTVSRMLTIKMLEQTYLEHFLCGNFHFVQSTPQ